MDGLTIEELSIIFAISVYAAYAALAIGGAIIISEILLRLRRMLNGKRP